MKIAFGFLLLLCAPAMWADSLVCTSNNGSNVIPCSSSPLNIRGVQFPVVTISGNTLSMPTSLLLDTEGSFTTDPYTPQFSVTATVNDTLAFPSSPAGDIYKASGGYFAGVKSSSTGARGSATLFVQIGPGTSSSPEINLNPFLQPPAYCPPGGSLDCSLPTTILPADAFSFMAVQASASLSTNGYGSFVAGVSSGEFLTFSRFKADGVTPDPFTTTPEPSSWGLLLVSGAALALRAKKRRLHRS